MRAALILLVVAACSPPDRRPAFRAAGHATPRDGGTLHIATSDAISTLDPTIQYDEVSTIAVHSLFETLVGYEPTGVRVVPKLAERWELSADGLVYHFTLRDGLSYSDGSSLVAQDVAYSLERARTDVDSPFGGQLADVASVTAPTARDLEIRLTRPDVAFIYVMAMPFTTPQKKEHVLGAGDQLRRQPLGSGPFMLEEWQEGQRIVLRKNPHYWDAANVHLDAISWLENIPRDTQFMMFERGEIDTIDKLSTPDYLWIAEQAAWQPYIRHAAAMYSYGSRMNVRVKPFSDRRVRQALNYALDKSHSVKLRNGGAVASHGLLPPGMPGRDDTLTPYPHDPAKARALLAEAGYPHGFDTDYMIFSDEFAEKLAASLQHDLAEVGVRVHIQVSSIANFGTLYGKPDGPPFSMDAWIGDAPDPTSFLDVKFHSRSIADQSSANESFYANPALDELLDRARAEREPAARAELYKQAERILYDDVPWIWDHHPTATEVLQPYVQGYAPHPVWVRDFTTTWLDLDAQGRRVRE
ncbi:MAG TPA: ABC transporter substrate-binding protein [Kofleriaceae bacterium]|nr:ABC transporter substrate-binding protein [Kofleriaceae bacterium]